MTEGFGGAWRRCHLRRSLLLIELVSCWDRTPLISFFFIGPVGTRTNDGRALWPHARDLSWTITKAASMINKAVFGG